MYLCYVDESGTSSIPGNTSHFVLAGLSIPIWRWKSADGEITAIKKRFGLGDAELHTAWMLRKYIEQTKVKGFKSLNYADRRSQVESLRRAELLRLQKGGNSKHYRQTKKTYAKTADYAHLTLDERRQMVLQVAACVGKWGFARLFAECIDKVYFDPTKRIGTLDEQSFEQLISRYEKYLQSLGAGQQQQNYGVVIHDNNPTVASKHTRLMRQFHHKGTPWTELNSIIETPLFVDSQLTSMVQITDLCAYALRRYLENGENELFDHVFKRAARKNDVVVGIRHFTNPSCKCQICLGHNRGS